MDADVKTRNLLAHDYDGAFALEKFHDIIMSYYSLFELFREKVACYYDYLRHLAVCWELLLEKYEGTGTQVL